ncbi:MAG: aspartate carbamoyltransferase catalytic subunit [Terricaulis sp.]
MAQRPSGTTKSDSGPVRFRHKHLLAIGDLDRFEIAALLDRAETFEPMLEQKVKKLNVLHGRTLINLFFENSTRTQSSFELAGKRMGADVVNMSVKSSSVAKGETLIDTAATLNAMRPDLLVVRHAASGAAELLARKVDCAVINAGDGQHEHPTQALLDAFTIRRRLGAIEGLTIAICGDVLHSRVARSNVALLNMLGASVHLIGPPTLMPAGAERWGARVFHDMREGLKGADVVMMLRVQRERMDGGHFPSAREYFWFYGLDEDKLKLAKPGALVMHPGPMNRGVEIDSSVADNPNVSLIETQVRMGVAVRMAVLEALAESGANGEHV